MKSISMTEDEFEESMDEFFNLTSNDPYEMKAFIDILKNKMFNKTKVIEKGVSHE